MDNRPDNRRWTIDDVKIVLFILAACFCGAASMAYADKITMKDGKVYEGRITGKSDRRYVMALDAGGEEVSVSIFTDEVDKVEMGRESVKRQIPYLKEVEKVKVKTGGSRIYEMSLDRKTGASQGTDPTAITHDAALKSLDDKERAYYEKFDAILKRHEEDFVYIEQLYADLPKATPEDFVQAKQLMDQVYFEVNALEVPTAFKPAHMLFLNSVKATFLAFGALEKGLLEEAQQRINESVQGKLLAAEARRELLEVRREKIP
jgi:hypothetical protein